MNTNMSAVAPAKGGGSSILWGVVQIICGILAISLPLGTSIALVLILAWVILFAGIAHLIFAFHGKSTGALLWQLLVAVVYLSAGVYMLIHPLLGVLSLTLVLAVFLLFEAAVELALYFRIRRIPHARWVLFDGVVTLILGLLIWAHWPSSSVWVIGTLVGISLIFSGISRFMLDLAVRNPAHS